MRWFNFLLLEWDNEEVDGASDVLVLDEGNHASD